MFVGYDVCVGGVVGNGVEDFVGGFCFWVELLNLGVDDFDGWKYISCCVEYVEYCVVWVV